MFKHSILIKTLAIIFIIQLLIAVFPAYSKNIAYEKIIKQIQNTLNCESSTAKKIFNIINMFADDIQSIISLIASSSNSNKFNERYIKEVVQQYFESEKSIVQVSSRSRENITTYFIKEYFYHLKNLKQKYGYTKVELTFDPEYLGMSKFEKVGRNKYELSVCMWQLFSGYVDDFEIYNDATRKKFRFMFRKIDNTLTVSIDQICVAETISKKRYLN